MGIRLIRVVMVWSLLCAHALASPSPDRVLSTNLCTDTLVLLLADPPQIAGLSPLARDCRIAPLCERAQGFPIVASRAEDVLDAGPDLVVGGTFGAALALRVARMRGIRVLALPPVDRVDDIAAQIIMIADALGHAERGAKLAQDVEVRLARLRQKRAAQTEPSDSRSVRAAWLEPHGVLSSAGSLANNLMREAGLSPMTGAITLERLVLDRPDLLVTERTSGPPSRAEAATAHPVLSAAFRAAHHLTLSRNATICGSPQTLDTLSALIDARHAVLR